MFIDATEGDMYRRDFLKYLGIASVLPPIATASAASQEQSSSRILLGEFGVAGFQYHEGMRSDVAAELRFDKKLMIAREPDNPFDPSAIKVMTASGQMLGYVPRKHNRVLASLADHGVRLEAELVNYSEELDAWDRLKISLWALIPANSEPVSAGSNPWDRGRL